MKLAVKWVPMHFNRSSALKLLATLLLLGSLGYFGRQLWGNLHLLPDIRWDIGSAIVLALSVAGTMATILLIGVMWLLLIRDQGVHISWRDALQIVAVSQFGKYLPGNIGHFTGRALLAQRAGVPVGKTVATMAIEIVWTLAISASLTLAALLFLVHDFHEGLVDDAHPGYLLTLILVLLLSPSVGIRTLNAMAPGISRKIGRGELVRSPSPATALAVAGLMVMCFAILGGILKMQSNWLLGHDEIGWLELTLLFTVAWTMGYVVPGTPGGLGIREAVMVKLLGPVVGVPVAIGLSISMRLTSMLGDALAFLLGWLLRRRKPQ